MNSKNIILNHFKDIGFKFHKFTSMNGLIKLKGKSLEYKYSPSYMINTHYTLVVFITHTYVEWRLYEHKNTDGSCASILPCRVPFQISYYNSEFTQQYRNYNGYDSSKEIHKKLNEIFPLEGRQQKLKRILK